MPLVVLLAAVTVLTASAAPLDPEFLKISDDVSEILTHHGASLANVTTVACVGDSITQGYLSSGGMTYPNQLQKLLGASYKATTHCSIRS